MSRFSDFTEDTDLEINVSGSFECQRCDDYVDGAHLDEDGTLWWTCPKRHISKIKDFM